MQFADSNHAQNQRMIRRTISSGMNLLLIASFIAAPASIVISSPISYAAPLPFPPIWMSTIADHLNNGKLTQSDVDTLKTKGGGSYKTLDSIVSRINQLAAQQKSPFRLSLSAVVMYGTKKLEPAFGNKVTITVTVINQATGDGVGEYDLGTGTYDIGEAMQETSVSPPSGMVDS